MKRQPWQHPARPGWTVTALSLSASALAQTKSGWQRALEAAQTQSCWLCTWAVPLVPQTSSSPAQEWFLSRHTSIQGKKKCFYFLPALSRPWGNFSLESTPNRQLYCNANTRSKPNRTAASDSNYFCSLPMRRSLVATEQIRFKSIFLTGWAHQQLPAWGRDALCKAAAEKLPVLNLALVHSRLFNKMLISSLNYTCFSNVLSMFAIPLFLLAGKHPGKRKAEG